MKSFKVSILLIICTISFCEAQNNHSNAYVVQSNTEIIYYFPSTEKLNAIKNSFSNENDFYTAADDANNYSDIAIEYLSTHNIQYSTTNKEYIWLSYENIELQIPSDMRFGCFFIYERGNCQTFVFPVDLSKWFDPYSDYDNQYDPDPGDTDDPNGNMTY